MATVVSPTTGPEYTAQETKVPPVSDHGAEHRQDQGHARGPHTDDSGKGHPAPTTEASTFIGCLTIKHREILVTILRQSPSSPSQSTVCCHKTSRPPETKSVNIDVQSNGQHHTALKAKLDTGAQANILPIRIYRRMYPQNLKADGFPKLGTLNRAHTVLTAYGGTRIKQYGTCNIQCEYKGQQTTATFFYHRGGVSSNRRTAHVLRPQASDIQLCTTERDST